MDGKQKKFEGKKMVERIVLLRQNALAFLLRQRISIRTKKNGLRNGVRDAEFDTSTISRKFKTETRAMVWRCLAHRFSYSVRNMS